MDKASNDPSISISCFSKQVLSFQTSTPLKHLTSKRDVIVKTLIYKNSRHTKFHTKRHSMPYLLLLLSLLGLSACSSPKEQDENNLPVQTKTIEIHSINELNDLFADLNYTSESWKAGQREVPRIYFAKISQDWKQTSDKIPVKEKKNIFFRLLGPLVLMSNEEIEKERLRLSTESKDSSWTRDLALKYRVIKKDEQELSQARFDELKKRVDIIPPSLALAQGAEESGWGTSRFAAEGNALFGQWDFSGEGMRPTQQRKELGDYGLARFDTALDSVKGYMLNLNTSHAYEKLRTLRQELRTKNEKVTGWKLAETLDKYSERGKAYIDGLHDMMSYNKLQATDDAYLANGPEIHLKKAKQ